MRIREGKIGRQESAAMVGIAVYTSMVFTLSSIESYRSGNSTYLWVPATIALVLAEVLFRLTARKGAFPLMPEFGSSMYLLRREKPSARQVLARQYAAEALESLDSVSVTDAEVIDMGDHLKIRVELVWQGQALAVELEG